MLDLDTFKKHLGDTAFSMTNKEIEDLREQQDQMAEIFFNMWQEETNQKETML